MTSHFGENLDNLFNFGLLLCFQDTSASKEIIADNKLCNITEDSSVASKVCGK